MASETPRLDAAVPILSVADMTTALDYYQQVLGFTVAWTAGDPPQLVSVCRDAVSLNLRRSENTGVSSVYFETTGLTTLYNSVATAAQVVTPIGDRPYGMRDFTLADPDGNVLSFGEPST